MGQNAGIGSGASGSGSAGVGGEDHRDARRWVEAERERLKALPPHVRPASAWLHRWGLRLTVGLFVAGLGALTVLQVRVPPGELDCREDVGSWITLVATLGAGVLALVHSTHAARDAEARRCVADCRVLSRDLVLQAGDRSEMEIAHWGPLAHHLSERWGELLDPLGSLGFCVGASLPDLRPEFDEFMDADPEERIGRALDLAECIGLIAERVRRAWL